jgi:hypothetical protein
MNKAIDLLNRDAKSQLARVADISFPRLDFSLGAQALQ